MHRLLTIILIFAMPHAFYTDANQRGSDEYRLLSSTGDEICTICDCMERIAKPGSLKIDCSKRGLVDMPQIKNNWSVEMLDLSQNNFREVPDLSARAYYSLQILHLNENHIKTVTENLFSRNLSAIYLDTNVITHIDAKVLKKIDNQPNLTEITLHNNPWICNCDPDTVLLAEFIRRHARKYPEITDITCVNSKVKLVDDVCLSETSYFIAVTFVSVAFAAIFGFFMWPFYLFSRMKNLRNDIERQPQFLLA